MRTNLKSLFALFALATTFTLASCQSEPIEPSQKPSQTQPLSETDDDEDKPPKDAWPGSN